MQLAPNTEVEQVGRYRRPSVCLQRYRTTPQLLQEAPTHPSLLLDDYGPQSSGQAHLSVPNGCTRLGAGGSGQSLFLPPPLPDMASVLF